MKSLKYIPVILLLLAGNCLNAQMFIGGNVSFNTSHRDQDRVGGTRTTNTYSLGLMPGLGKYLSDNLAIGLALDLSLTKSKIEDTNTSSLKTSNIGFNPFIRYYLISWNKLFIYGQGNIGIDFSKTTDELNGASTESNGTQFSLSINPGLIYDISENVSLFTSINILSLGYNYSTTKEGTLKDKSSAFNIGAGLDDILLIGGINIGAIYKF
jgi:opacity protein-like surface antigen